MATFTKRGGKVAVQIRRKGMGSVCRTFSDKKSAERWAVQTELAIERGEYEATPKVAAKPDKPSSDPKGITLGQLLERYRDDVSTQHKGSKEEKARINAILKEPISSKLLSDVKSVDWAELKDKRLKEIKTTKSGKKKQIKPQTLKREFNIYKKAYKLAKLEWNYTELDNPLENIKLSGKSKKRDRRLTEKEYAAVLAEARRRKNPLVAYVIEWAKESAMRRSEILRIEWRHINFAGRELLIEDQKNNEVDRIPLTKKMIAILEAQDPTNDLVFPIKLANLESTVKRVLEAVGLKGDFTFHGWRHERVSALFEAGLNIPEVQKISRHRDVAALMGYTHIRNQAVLAKLERETV